MSSSPELTLGNDYIILDSDQAIREFKRSTATMSNIDYDLLELISLIFDLLGSGGNVGNKIEAFVTSYLDYGDTSNYNTNLNNLEAPPELQPITDGMEGTSTDKIVTPCSTISKHYSLVPSPKTYDEMRNDGIILSSALRKLAWAIHESLAMFYVYEQDGSLSYIFHSLTSGDSIVMVDNKVNLRNSF